MKDMKLLIASILLTILGLPSLEAQVVSFEGAVPYYYSSSNKKGLSISDKYYKDGGSSLMWNFTPGSTMEARLPEPIQLNPKKEKTYGITFWIYNEKPEQDSIRIQFLNDKNEVAYEFGYRLAANGWRACWEGFKTMKGKHEDNQTITAFRMVAPDRKGRIFIDRLKLPEPKMNLRTTPDMQVDGNALAEGRDLWHWCRVWEWEKKAYDIPLTPLSDEDKKSLQLIAQRMDKEFAPSTNNASAIKKAEAFFRKAKIEKSGTGYVGSPVVAPDELNRGDGDITWSDLEAMLSGFALDAYCNHNSEALHNYFLVWDYAINQGFAYGSGMGTNHHYGYQVRKIYTTAWLLRNEIEKSKMKDEILKTLAFWSGLQETRVPIQENRDELVDSWHTLLMARMISAMMMPDDAQKIQALKGLSRWVAGSLKFTSGTLGGIKVDGTTFHHGGFYPAYTTGALAAVAIYVTLTNDTPFQLTHENCVPLMTGLLAMRNYTDLVEWGYSLAGRHPFEGKLGPEDIEAFARMALSNAEKESGEEFNRSLAADYIRLMGNKKSEERSFFESKGVKAAEAPQGFFVYNYGAAGIHRRDNWMVTLKGFNTNVWGSEIYAKDNRFGRYLSYGSIQIMSKPSLKASGYQENGWNWNRIPGATTINLPLDLLDSPLKGSLMARNKQDFSGTSSLEGKNGMFVLRLQEANYTNFTPDFVARKSAFCFDNRIVYVGTGINNSNTTYQTETTIFQNVFVPGQTPVSVNGQVINQVGFKTRFRGTPRLWLSDGYNNYYQVPDGLVYLTAEEQQSAENRVKKPTQGVFATAFINHGVAPKDAQYTYMALIQPTPEQLKKAEQELPYTLLRRDNQAHVVYDKATGITAYALFEKSSFADDKVIDTVDEECMVMRRDKSTNSMVMSVCDPNLHIEDKSYTTEESSKPSVKRVVLKGVWKLATPSESIKLQQEGDKTILDITCINGRPNEFVLTK